MTARARTQRTRRIGVIDIGTNSTKLTVGTVRNQRVSVVAFARRPSRLGERLAHSGRISQAAAERTARDVRALGTLARSHGADVVVAVGTYAFRSAKNGRAVAREMARRTGVPIRVLTGREEATLAYLSALALVERPQRVTFLIDVGGGSTEFVVARRGRIASARSLPLGALRLTERRVHSDPITARERRALEREIDTAVTRAVHSFRRVRPSDADFVASGGSVTTALAMLAPRRRASRSTAARISRRDLATLADACYARTLAQRKRLPGLPADRADIIPAGLSVVLAFMRQTRKRTLIVSGGGIREGAILVLDAEMEWLAHERSAHRH
jgi:exopolyphosphatase/guanosine-5'-triphosphate,3'-diphosphate pyrophosphatase